MKYRDDELIVRLNNNNNYKVELGFGLHVGQAIEGAIGTDFKIDTTYLGDAVETTLFLESLTKSYRTPLLFSGELKNILSKAVVNMPQIRQIDQIELTTGQRHELFTFDLGDDISYLPSANQIS